MKPTITLSAAIGKVQLMKTAGSKPVKCELLTSIKQMYHHVVYIEVTTEYDTKHWIPVTYESEEMAIDEVTKKPFSVMSAAINDQRVQIDIRYLKMLIDRDQVFVDTSSSLSKKETW